MLKLKNILVLSFAISLQIMSCKSLPDNPPIPQKDMSAILLDMQIAETYSQGLGDSVTNKFEKNYDSLNGFYSSVLKKYKISFEDFEEAMDWYQSRPVLMDSLMKNTIELMAKTKAKEKIKDYDPEKERQRADSLKAIQAKDTLKKKNINLDSLKKTITADTTKTAVKNPRLVQPKADNNKKQQGDHKPKQ